MSDAAICSRGAIAGAVAGAAVCGACWQCLKKRAAKVSVAPLRRHGPQGTAVAAAGSAFAVVTGDGLVRCWGAPEAGGILPKELEKASHQPLDLTVAAVVATDTGFAALTSAGTGGNLVAWGGSLAQPLSLLDGSVTRRQFSHIAATRRSVLVQGDDGVGVLFGEWGTAKLRVEPGNKVVEMVSTAYADACMTQDGKVFVVGPDEDMAPSSMHNVVHLYATAEAFAALRQDGTVVPWGSRTAGGAADHGRGCVGLTGLPLLPAVTRVHAVVATAQAFAALTEDGFCFAWGSPDKGGDPGQHLPALHPFAQAAPLQVPAVAARSRPGAVAAVAATRSAFAAVTKDKRVLVWGSASFGGDQAAAERALDGRRVNEVVGGHFAFVALCEDGTIASWGDTEYGGKNCPDVRDVKELWAGPRVFAAVYGSERTLITWGSQKHGGKTPEPPIQNVAHVTFGEHAVVVVDRSSNMYAFGNSERGGRIEA
eukprot:gene16665-25571_t